jgi:hypothetical protein
LLFLEYGWSIEEKKELVSTFHRLILLHSFPKEEEVVADELEFQLLFLEYVWSIEEKKELGSTFKRLILFHILLKKRQFS